MNCLGFNVLEEKSHRDSIGVSWCWALTHVCWQCCNATCSQSETGYPSNELAQTFFSLSVGYLRV